MATRPIRVWLPRSGWGTVRDIKRNLLELPGSCEYHIEVRWDSGGVSWIDPDTIELLVQGVKELKRRMAELGAL